jgi:flagellin
MRINNNISAIITNKQLLGTENSLAASMEKLSSGLKINHASDNPSGMAIAGKMRAQIKGLDKASQNSQDASSVMQTVDGALSEVADMLQRMRELAVQAANGVNAQDEKDAAQTEIASLRDEIDRISQTTEFNSKSLLDGSVDARVYPDQSSKGMVSRLAVSDTVAEGIYEFNIDNAATQASYASGRTINSLSGKDFSLTINDYTISINSGMTGEEIKAALRDGAEYANASLDIDSNTDEISFISNKYGAGAELTISQYCETDDPFDITVIPNTATDPDAAAYYTEGTNAKVTLDTTSGFGDQATVSYDGNRITVTDNNGFSMDMLLTAGQTGAVSLEVTDIGIMDIQVGANKNQSMQVRIPSTSAESLYLDTIDVSVSGGARDALDTLSDAINTISRIRSQVGAYENRLDYTTDTLDTTEENMTSALSRIEDTDMAEEMTEYTKYNVLQQAGTSALAQANELPSLALQLLG